MRALAISATLTALCLLTIEAKTVGEGVAFAQSLSHGHAKGVYDDTGDEADNGPEPSAKYDKNAPTAYEVDVAVDKEGVAEEDEQEQEDEGVAFVQSGSHGHAKRVYDDTDIDYDDPEPSAKDDKDAPTANEVDLAVDREGVAEADEQEQEDEGVAFVQSRSHGHAKGVYDDTEDVADNGPEPSAKDDKNAPTAYEVDVAVDKEGDAEEDEQEQEDEGVAFVQSGSHGHAKRVYDDTDIDYDNPEPSAKDDKDAPTANEVDLAVDREGVAEEDEQEQEDEGVAFVQSGSHLRGSSKADPTEEDSAKTRRLEALQPVLDRLKGLDGKAYSSLSNMIAQATMQH